MTDETKRRLNVASIVLNLVATGTLIALLVRLVTM
jgi:hypothetical protein